MSIRDRLYYLYDDIKFRRRLFLPKTYSRIKCIDRDTHKRAKRSDPNSVCDARTELTIDEKSQAKLFLEWTGFATRDKKNEMAITEALLKMFYFGSFEKYGKKWMRTIASDTKRFVRLCRKDALPLHKAFYHKMWYDRENEFNALHEKFVDYANAVLCSLPPMQAHPAVHDFCMSYYRDVAMSLFESKKTSTWDIKLIVSVLLKEFDNSNRECYTNGKGISKTIQSELLPVYNSGETWRDEDFI